MREYYKTRLAIYIMFVKDNKILLSKRRSTGYKDGWYGFVQGHIENGETPTEAAIREAKEEAGVVISPEDLEFGLVCHNQVEVHYIDFFFVCEKWDGEIKNMEHDKCEELKWYDISSLPELTMFQVLEYIKNYKEGKKLVEIM
ncbi:MAG: NUDIX domain-containing protein [Lactobacillaceae bacterium]|jgi:mutator protein MutT|nr:NUDIX domain-containing protein [Lactobacillaceae bacterium]